MTIHPEHPFADPPEARDPARRLRGRLGGVVTLLTAGEGAGRAGLTISSVMVALGEPAHLLALVDPDSDLAAAVRRTGRAALSLLSWHHRDLADAFAGLTPAPGGPFRTGRWRQTGHGPVLEDAGAWAGLAVPDEPVPVGWSVLLDGLLEEVHLADPGEPLVHRRGRYLRPSGSA